MRLQSEVQSVSSITDIGVYGVRVGSRCHPIPLSVSDTDIRTSQRHVSGMYQVCILLSG
ncbi:MAG: hypothetical protein GY749_18765 [Desulfobacteraceae bacterium]|nr:hypothetical protein [Desulfobacteraceae bacterium]